MTAMMGLSRSKVRTSIHKAFTPRKRNVFVKVAENTLTISTDIIDSTTSQPHPAELTSRRSRIIAKDRAVERTNPALAMQIANSLDTITGIRSNTILRHPGRKSGIPGKRIATEQREHSSTLQSSPIRST
mmetsp:Transcript_72540/g.151480  ORF Transcript_72540/g.151480 Transcript_72540/m.151480 type:complete len:130 (+) Transcript_72540:99-488(+)